MHEVVKEAAKTKGEQLPQSGRPPDGLDATDVLDFLVPNIPPLIINPFLLDRLMNPHDYYPSGVVRHDA